MLFELKSITFLGRKVQILLQNENGPCPLLAIANVLLLQNRFTIHVDKACISLSELIAEVAEVIVEQTSKMAANTQTRQQALDSVLNILPRLAKGLDLNVRFTGVTAYEFTEEVTVFDALDLPLVHGWVLDSQDRQAAAVVGQNSYNHLMYKLVEYRSLLDRLASADTAAAAKRGRDDDVNDCGNGAGPGADDKKDADKPGDYVLVGPSDGKEHEAGSKSSDTDGEHDKADDAKADSKDGAVAPSPEQLAPSKKDSDGCYSSSSSSSGAKGCTGEPAQLSADEEELLRHGPVIETFLTETASQLTYVGLLALYQHVRERQLAIFFRNDHFSTMFSYGGQLFLLVTDLGYQREPSVVWELLDEIDGDTGYVDGGFVKARPLSFASPELLLVPGQGASSSLKPPSSPPAPMAAAADVALAGAEEPWSEEGTVAHRSEGAAVPANDAIDADLLLALQLQGEEEAAARDLRGATAARPTPSSSASAGRGDRDFIASQYTTEQLDYMRAQEMQYEEYANNAQAGAPLPPQAVRGGGGGAAAPPPAAAATRQTLPRRQGGGQSASNSKSPCTLC